MVEVLGVRSVEKYVVYLGMPTIVERLREVVFRCLVNRLTKKLKDWNLCLRLETYIGKVDCSINYDLFKIPHNIIQKIDRSLLGSCGGKDGMRSEFIVSVGRSCASLREI